MREKTKKNMMVTMANLTPGEQKAKRGTTPMGWEGGGVVGHAVGDAEDMAAGIRCNITNTVCVKLLYVVFIKQA